MKKKTRKQIVVERRNKLINHLYYKEGFVLDEIAEIFRLSEGRISQILNINKQSVSR